MKFAPSYQQNIQQIEHQKEQLDRDAKRISDFIGHDDRFPNIDPIEQELMREQCETMWQLSEILGKRVARFKELSKRTDAAQTSAIGEKHG